MANRSINELDRTTTLADHDLLVLWKDSANAAYSIEGEDFKEQLLQLVDGRGYIQNITKTGTSGLVDTYTITFTEGINPVTFTVTNGAKGDTGDQTYVYIRYASEEPTSDDQMGDVPDVWIGIYVGEISNPNLIPYYEYQWYKWEGPAGSGVAYTVAGQPIDGSVHYTMYTQSGEECGSFDVINGVGAVSTVNSINPDTNHNVQIFVSTVEDLTLNGSPLVVGSATIADAYAALLPNQMLICPATDFITNELPLVGGNRITDGTIEICKGDGTDGWVEYHGRTASVGNYRMFFNPSNIPSGKWLGKCDLLWTNSAPTSSFAAQTVAVDLSGYDFVMVVAYESTSADVEMSTTIRNAVGTKGRLFLMANSRQFRAIEIASTGVTFGVGRSGAVGANAVEDNTAAVPVYIYGISK